MGPLPPSLPQWLMPTLPWLTLLLPWLLPPGSTPLPLSPPPWPTLPTPTLPPPPTPATTSDMPPWPMSKLSLKRTTRLTQQTQPQDFIQRRNRTEHAVQQVTETRIS